MTNSRQRRASKRYWRYWYTHNPSISFERNLQWHATESERIAWCNANIGPREYEWSITANGWQYHFHREQDAILFNLKWAA